MTQLPRRRLEFVAAGFLAEMRKQFVLRYPDKECPIGTLADYSPDQISAMMAGMEKALQFASPEMDRTFQAWLDRQEQEAAEQLRG